jgi:hypothetical protein
MRRVRGVPLCAALTWLAACAAPLPETELRVLLQLAHPSSDSAAIARLVSNRAGVTARYLGSSSLSWHALVLPCSGADECEAVLQRLRTDRAAFEAVERDERKRIVTP